jgi:pyruvate kinase
MPRATKIVATLGPASSDPEVLERLIRAGVDVVRLNFSHGKAQDHIDRATWCAASRQGGQAGGADGRPAGPEDPRRQVRRRQGDAVPTASPSCWTRSAPSLGDVDGVGLDYKELPRDVRPGDTLLLNDGLIVLTVDAVRGEQVHTVVKVGGELSNNKGINKQGGGLTAPALTAKDMEDIKTAMAFQAEYVAVSFPKNATDMEMARQLANVAGEPRATSRR